MSTKTANDYAQAIRHLTKVDPVLGAAIKRIPQPQIKRRRANHFRALVQSIIAQQLSDKVADVLILRFRKLFPGRAFPTPQQVLQMPDEKIRATGISYGKISYIKDLAHRVHSKELVLHKLKHWPEKQIIEYLVQVKGIGRWTAEMFLIFSLERPDIFSHGDLGLRNAIQKLYGFKKPPTVKQVEKIVAKWSPYRSLASRYLWRILDEK
jgi:DNA-3-methyladenine glycosylase II